LPEVVRQIGPDTFEVIGVVLSRAGTPVKSVGVTVTDLFTASPATIYSDRHLRDQDQIASLFADNYGIYRFFVQPGKYRLSFNAGEIRAPEDLDLGNPVGTPRGGGGGAGGAPTDAQYVVTAAHADLTAEKILGTQVIMSGLEADRPAPSIAGRLWFSTDTGKLYRDTAAAWTFLASTDLADMAERAHASLTGLGVDDHHPQDHASRHADGGADEIVDATQSPSTQAFGDAASAGADTNKAAPVLHKHAMPANPVTAHEAAADPHTGYQKESEKGALNGYASLDAGGKVPDTQIPDAIARDTELHAENHATRHAENGADEVLVEDLGTAGLTANRVPKTDGLGGLAIGQVGHGELSGIGTDDHHARDHAVTGAPHTHSGGVAGRFLRETSATAFAFEAIAFSRGGTMLDPVAKNIIVWRAPFACTVTNVRGYRVGGTGATVNARKNGTLNHLAADLSLTSADSWMDGGAVQNAAYAAGDKLEIMIVSVAGTPTQVAVQVDYTRP
jgi:hypothetical protein